MKNKIVVLYIPCPNQKLIHKIALKLLEEKAAVCVQHFPVQSAFLWHKSIEKTDEFILIAKTMIRKSAHAKKIIKAMHPYEIPCIIKFEAEVNKEYYNWMKETLKKK